MNLKKFRKNWISVDVEKVLISLNIPYKSTSRDFVIRCISGRHPDLDPSLCIDREKGVFKCWSCGYTGNLVVLVAKFFGVTKTNAAVRLTELGAGAVVDDEYFEGLQIRKKRGEKSNENGGEKVKISMPTTFLNINENHQMFLSYLSDRQVDFEMIKSFQIKCCLVGYYNYRIVVPVFHKSETVGFVARDILSKEDRFERGGKDYKKYLFPKGCHIGNYLFNYDVLDPSKELYVVEGIFDVFALWRQGYYNATCVFGLHVSDKQEKLLRPFKRIVVIPDQKGGGAVTLTESVRKALKYHTIFETILPKGTDANNIFDLNKYISVSTQTVIKPRVSVSCDVIGKKEVLLKKNKI